MSVQQSLDYSWDVDQLPCLDHRVPCTWGLRGFLYEEGQLPVEINTTMHVIHHKIIC